MADSVASTQSQPPHTASKKRRQATVSTETENKLARAARSAQRLAQLSDATRDDTTLDLFPDDPTRATLEAMNIDIRQGTLHGFELPDVVLAAVGAVDPADSAQLEAKARRANRAAKTGEAAPVNAQLDGLEMEPLRDGSGFSVPPVNAEPASGTTQSTTVEPQPASAAPPTSVMAAATVARSVTALRQAAEQSANKGVAKAAPRFATTFAKAASASASASPGQEAASDETQADVGAQTVSDEDAAHQTQPDAKSSGQEASDPGAEVDTQSTQTPAALASTWRATRTADATPAHAAPELDRARATAFADTVDALYGVIADQRHAATDHSRRMKWMLSIVVGALLVTVAIGITQTLLLMRLTRETTAQQHRVEQMMQNQQAAMASLIDTHLAMANASASASTNAPANEPAKAATATASPAGTDNANSAAQAHGKHASHTHAHKPKSVTAH